MRQTQPLNRKRGRRIAAAAVGFVLIAAACSNKKDEDSVGGADATTPAAGTESAATTPVDTASESGGTETTAAATEETTADTEAPEETTPALAPVMGGTLVVSGEAEVANPWTPAAMNCDSYCQERARTFYDPLVTYGDDLKIHPVLAESVEPNDDATQWTVKVRPGIAFHDGTPLDADAVIYNLQATGTGVLVSGSLTDVAKVPNAADPSKMDLKIEKVDDMTFTIFTGKNGDPNQPVSWPDFNAYLAGQWGLIASPTWLEAVKGDPALASQPVGTGPFIFQSYAPRDRLVVTRNPDYWMTDPQGNQLPYLDSIEFRVIEDSETAGSALESGDINVFSTSSARVIAGFQDQGEDFTIIPQDELGETNYLLIDQSKPGPLQDQRVRCALSMAIDRQQLIDATSGGILTPANGLFSPGQQGYLEDNGLPMEQDLETAKSMIDEYESETGQQVTFQLGHTPTRVNDESSELLQGWWSEIGVEANDEIVPQDQFINLALFGDPKFQLFIWRQHAGVGVDQQYFWWHSAGSHPNGELSLNFGRLDVPAIDEALDAARTSPDEATRDEAAETVNKSFAEGCYYIPLSWTLWGVISEPSVKGFGTLTLPDGAKARDGAGFGGQFWTHTLFIDQG